MEGRWAEKFLGMTIVDGSIAISHKALQSAMAKVKEFTLRVSHLTLEKTIEQINTWVHCCYVFHLMLICVYLQFQYT